VWQLHTRNSFPHPEIEMVQGASPHADEDFILPRLGVGHVFVAENLRATEFVNAHGFHGSLLDQY
jgi:hypothetical protein